MVELLRDPLRNYEPDQTAAIKNQNIAKTLGDITDLTGATATIASDVNRIRDNLAQADVEQAQRNLEVPMAELAAWNAENLRNGEIADSPAYQQKYRQKAEEIFSKYNKDLKWQKAKDTYTSGKKDYIEKGIAANIRFAAQKRDYETATGQTKQLQTADTTADDYYQKMRALGNMGNMSDGQGLTTETLAALGKALGDAGTPQERQRALTEVATRGGMEWIVGLSQYNPELADAIINNDDSFVQYMPAEFRDNIIEMRRQEQIDDWGRQRALLVSELQTTNEKSPRARELNKEIKKLDEKINDFSEDEEFDKKTISEARETFKSAVEPAMRRVTGARSFAARQAAYEQQKNVFSNGVITFSPVMENFLNQQVEREKAERNQSKINPETGMAYEMSPDMSDKKGKWEEIRDNYVGYRNEMTNYSQLVESTPESKAAVNYQLEKLLTLKPTDEKGDPTDFEAESIKFLYNMSRAPITESERRDYANIVGQAMIARNNEIQDLREILQSGDVGIYPKGGLKGVVEYDANDLPVDRPDLANSVRLEDERATFWNPLGATRKDEFGRAQYENVGSFDKMLRRAQSEYQTNAVNMAVNGASKQEILNTKKQIFDKAINDWYATRYVVDLNELDRKLANKEPAYQNIDGIIYEYRGRDSIGRPLWKDNSVLNTNRDFSRINKSYKMGQQ